MDNPKQWPTWTACISPLAYAQLGHFYFENVGFRHKSIVQLKKTSTDLLYQVESDQGWECRTIIWTSSSFTPFNCPNNPSSRINNSEEYEITPFMGILQYSPNNNRKTVISWNEDYYIINPPPAPPSIGPLQAT
jgi:hypothetical protein